MGYFVNIVDSTFTIPAANLDTAYRRMVALNDRDDLKRGGVFGANTDPAERAKLGYDPDRWFSWMGANYPATCADAAAILRALGFELRLEDGDLVITGYDSKTGQEDVFLTAISDLATGTIVWQGEDGERWRETYGEPAVKVEVAGLVWGEPTDRTLDHLPTYVNA